MVHGYDVTLLLIYLIAKINISLKALSVLSLILSIMCRKKFTDPRSDFVIISIRK